MEILKLTSIRLSKSSLSVANALAKKLGYYRSSEVLRVAIWVGLKALKPGVMRSLLHMMWEEEEGFAYYGLEDVLRAAGIELENLKSSK